MDSAGRVCSDRKASCSLALIDDRARRDGDTAYTSPEWPARGAIAKTHLRTRQTDDAAVHARSARRAGTVETLPLPATRRVDSVDALRGFSMVWILGADGLANAIGEMSAGNETALGTIGTLFGEQFKHVDWEGYTFYDLIFPMFIFVTGVSIVFSLTKLVEREGMAAAHARVLRRSFLLFVLGVIEYGGFSESLSEVRVLGVLQRIALCYLFASLLFLNFRLRGLIVAFSVLLVGYWVLMTFVPVPGTGAGVFDKETNLAWWIDAQYLPGRLWDQTRDPEGLLSTLPAIATCLLGVFAGLLMKNSRMPAHHKSLWLIGAGLAMVAAGHLWSLQFPIIKYIWTSSFVLVAGGYSALLLGLFHQVIDVGGYKAWARAFIWVGASAIVLYMLNMIVGFQPLATRVVGGDVSAWLDSAFTSGTGLLVSHALGVAFAIALARFLYRRRIFLRV